jgi:hypothetical protein
MEIFAIVGALIAYFNSRNAKADGISEPKPAKPEAEPSVQKLLRPEAGRRERFAHWLGLEE